MRGLENLYFGTMISLLVANPLLLLFLVAGIGFLIGRIRVKGASLGIAAVLFVGLAFGALDPAIRLPDIVYQLGLLIFVYTIGLSGGADFVQTLRQRGMRDMVLVVVMLVFASVLAVILSWLFGLRPELAAGLYAGSLTNTPALAGVIETVKANLGLDSAMVALPTVGYSVGYPVGVVGMIGVLIVCRRLFHVAQPEESKRLKAYGVKTESVHNQTVRVTQSQATLVTIAELGRARGFEVVFGRLKRGDTMMLTDATTPLQLNDLVVLVGDTEGLSKATQCIGEPIDLHLEQERSEFDFRRIFVSNAAAVGKSLRELNLHARYGALVTRVRRGDFDLLPGADTVLQLGDRVRVLAHRDQLEQVSRFLGDSYRAISEVDVLVLSLGIALGLLIGLIPIPLPGGTSFKLGIAGGPLIVALVLGALQRTGPVVWTIPYSANLTLRQAGLVLFLAGIGTQAGYAFFHTMRTGGAVELLLSATIITCATGLLTLCIAYWIFKMPFGLAAGLVAGLQTQPAVLGFGIEQSQNDVPSTGYTAAFPVAMVTKIVLAQAVLSVLGLGRV